LSEKTPCVCCRAWSRSTDPPLSSLSSVRITTPFDWPLFDLLRLSGQLRCQTKLCLKFSHAAIGPKRSICGVCNLLYNLGCVAASKVAIHIPTFSYFPCTASFPTDITNFFPVLCCQFYFFPFTGWHVQSFTKLESLLLKLYQETYFLSVQY
jgi:hypothetical protein